MKHTIPPEAREDILGTITARSGLHFPIDRWPEVERGLEAAAAELGLGSAREAASRLMAPGSDRHSLEVIAKQLTVGETYFFRDPAAFKVLRNEILAPLIRSRREAGERRLRLWSAGCCRGEEAYSLAILVSELLPDLRDWRVMILGIDINRTFLRAAEAGIYRQWSFRGSSDEFRSRYFTELTGNRFAILPRIREMVTFRFLNLAEPSYPSFATNTELMDVILCRNVLIYFSPHQYKMVSGRLQAALAPGGWLLAGAEPAAMFVPLIPVTFPEVIAYQKPQLAQYLPAPPEVVHDTAAEDGVAAPERDFLPLADRDQGVEKLVHDAQASADAGRLDEALRLMDCAVSRNKLDARLHYLRGSMLQEHEQIEEAINSFRRAVHLDHRFVVAHFALGTLAGKKGRRAEQMRHLQGALEILRDFPADEVVPDSSGMTAARLAEVISTTMQPQS